MIFRLGELFCGPGGFGLGAKHACVKNNHETFKIEHAWATDYDKDSCLTYTNNICSNNPKSVIHTDIRNLDFNKLKSISDIDALVFGFPCNDFSLVGEKKGIDGIYGPLYQYGIKVLDFFKPKWFIAENVGGLKNANEGKTFECILEELDDVGYKVYPHLYKFNEYGIPQTRHRILIVGIQKESSIEFKIPSPEPYSKIDISSRNAIENPAILDNAFNNERTKQSETVIERLKHIKPGENAFTADLPDHLKLNVKSTTISHIYKRLHPDKPAYTVTGSGGGGTHVYHWEEPRALTNRERARLQTFPDDFVFEGSKESVRKQIGMAVPPMFSKIIFEAILSSYAGFEYNAAKQNIIPKMYSETKQMEFLSMAS